MAIQSVGTTSSSTIGAPKKPKGSDANQSNFMSLLVAQLRNQDPLSPATNEDFIAQLAQLESLDESKKMSTSLASMVSGQDFSSASTIIGKNVSGTSTSAFGDSVSFNGVVNSVSQENGKVKVKVTQADGTTVSVAMSEISEIMQAEPKSKI